MFARRNKPQNHNFIRNIKAGDDSFITDVNHAIGWRGNPLGNCFEGHFAALSNRIDFRRFSGGVGLFA